MNSTTLAKSCPIVKYRRGLVVNSNYTIKEAIILDYLDDKITYHRSQGELSEYGFYTTYDRIRNGLGQIMSRNTIAQIVIKLSDGDDSPLIKTVIAKGDSYGKRLYLRFRDNKTQKLIKSVRLDNDLDTANHNFFLYINTLVAREFSIPVAILVHVLPILIKQYRKNNEKTMGAKNVGWYAFTRPDLCIETGLTYDEVRAALDKMKSPALSFITIKNIPGCDKYQDCRYSLMKINER